MFCSSDENDTRILNKIRMMCEIFFEFGLVVFVFFGFDLHVIQTKQTNKKIMMNDGFFLIIHVMLILRSFGSSWINE